MVTSLNKCNNNYLNQNIVVSLDDKYGVIFEETSDKILVKSEESEDHNGFEIPKCKIMMWLPLAIVPNLFV
jgi:hypothetical protein